MKEFEKVFRKIGRVYWVTISGGEPFLRGDISKICKSLYDNCRPMIMTIATNGLSECIPEKVEKIVKACSETKIIVNLSIDGVGKKHDKIRGVRNNFKKTLENYKKLKGLKYQNLSVGLHTVISKFNVHNIPEIYDLIEKLNPDSYIVEIAEERKELNNIGADIMPSVEDCKGAMDFVFQKTKKMSFSLSPIKAFRLEYYSFVNKILKDKKQTMPCYAGFASAQITPNGDVWNCCIRGENMGNLRDVDYDFRKVWFGKKADVIRQNMKQKKCSCPLANVFYTNALCSFGFLFRIFINLVRSK